MHNRLAQFNCTVLCDEPMRKHTSFRIGGKAKYVVIPQDEQALLGILQLFKEENFPFLIIGNGSNVLFADEDYDGAVIQLTDGLTQMKLVEDNLIYCEAGVILARLAMFALENGLTGLEFAHGIPGSVGGAVFMNAGAYGGEIKDVIVFADHVDKEGRTGRFTGDELQMSYRHSVYSGKEYFITGAAFKLQKGDRTEIKAKMDDLLGRRFDKQPMDKPSAGSTFKRPEGAFASALIDQCGLKGYRIGGAEVSTKHAGFVVNIGGATAEDVLQLIGYIQEKVKNDTGFFIEPEIEILG